MVVVVRLGGALLAASDQRYFVVGEPKRPIDWDAAGLARPAHEAEPTTSERIPWFEVEPTDASRLGGLMESTPRLELPVELEAACDVLHERLTIRRNGSVSERLWELVVEHSRGSDEGAVDGRWLAETPGAVWDIVRDQMLRCV